MQMIPGELLVAPGEIELNAGRKTLRLIVANTGDRPIQVGSHYHFFETNEALRFDRAAARGFRLNIAAGTAVRFEPGQQREVELVALGGDRIVFGFNAKVMGPLDASPSRRKSPIHIPIPLPSSSLARAGARRSSGGKRSPAEAPPPPPLKGEARSGVASAARKKGRK